MTTPTPETPDQVLTPEPFGTETEPAAPGVSEPDPPIFAALVNLHDSAPPAADATTTSSTQPEDSAPVHEYQVTHRLRQPGAAGSYSAYTTAWHAAEDAVRFVREHTF